MKVLKLEINPKEVMSKDMFRKMEARDRAMEIFDSLDLSTFKHIAFLYDIPLKELEELYSKHEEEFIQEGVVELDTGELVLTTQASIKVGTLLPDNLVAKEVRTILMDICRNVSK